MVNMKKPIMVKMTAQNIKEMSDKVWLKCRAKNGRDTG